MMRNKTNPRSQNGNLRRKHRARFKAMAAPCGICGGRLGPIHYDEPSDAQHPLSFVIDEIKPISKHNQFGYETPRAAAEDWGNLQAAHWIQPKQERLSRIRKRAWDSLTGLSPALTGRIKPLIGSDSILAGDILAAAGDEKKIDVAVTAAENRICKTESDNSVDVMAVSVVCEVPIAPHGRARTPAAPQGGFNDTSA